MYKVFATAIAFSALMVSTMSHAQNVVDSERPWLKPADDKRAYVFIKNDYSKPIKLSMWNKRGTQVGDYWVLRPGQSGYLSEGGHKVAVSAEYTLKVGDDPGEIPVADVSDRHGKTWNVSVRRIWMATHQMIKQGK
jgi:hypothetical protein